MLTSIARVRADAAYFNGVGEISYDLAEITPSLCKEL